MRRPSLTTTLLATAIAAAALSPLTAMAATTSTPAPAMKMAPAPHHHHRRLVHVSGRIVSINLTTGRVTLSNHKTYHFKNVGKYKVGQKLTISYWI